MRSMPTRVTSCRPLAGWARRLYWEEGRCAAEDTLCGHLRRAIHRSRRPLADVADQAGISTAVLCGFLEGERTLRSDVLDRLAQAAEIHIRLTSSDDATGR